MLNKNNKNIFLFRSRFLKQKEYWIKKLSGDLTSTGILFDFDNGQPLETDDGKIEIPIPADLGARVVKLSKGSDLSIYILLLAALKILIFRYTANEDINIISPLDRWKVTEETINSLLFIRDQIEMGQTFKEVVLNIRQSVLDAYENQDYPYEMLLEYLYASAEQQNPRTISDTQCSLAGLHDDRNIEIIKSSLAIHFVRDEDRLRGYISYEIPTYKKSEVSRFAGHFLCLLASALENPGTRVADISILTEQEQEQLLVSFNDNKTGSAGDKTIVQFLQEQGEKIPDRVNLCCQAEHITYRELNRRVEVLAKVLRDSGVREERTVGILQARSPRLVESILAVWQAGGAYIPIDPDYPLERIEYMLKDSGAKLLVTTSSKEIEKVRRWEGEIILLDEINEFLKSNVTPLTHLPAHLQSPSNPDVVLSISTYQVRSAKLAYIIYTSGSTGRPKGAMIEHLGMMNHINAKITGLRLSDRSIVGQNASHTFDISVWQFFAVVVVGGKTVIYSNELILESGKFLKQLIKDQITVLEVVPSYLSLLLNPVRDEVFLPLEYLLVTGEEVKPSLVKQWFNRYPQIRMVNAYGPTEASDDITHYFMDKVPETARIPIGKPLQNFTIYIVDKNMNLCPIGVKGEIWVGGVGVGRGYLNNPEVTKDKFKTKFANNKSFFGGSRGAVFSKKAPFIYCTGDLARWLPDGNIEFLGRIDHQVKIRGFRIEIEEIETRLLTFESIKEAVVVDRADQHNPSSRYLCAYLVTHKNNEIDPDSAMPLTIPQLRAYLAAKLPEYMIPSYFIQLEKIPLTINGKVDRKVLPVPEIGNHIHAGVRRIPPQNEREKELAKIWIEILFPGVETPPTIWLDDNFFHLGGNSLKATTLIYRVHQAMNVLVPFREVFKNQTLQQFSRYIREADKERYLSINPVEKKEYYPVSSAQKRLFILDQYEEVGVSYNIPYTLIIEGNLDKKRLAKAFKALIKRHEALRTSFVNIQSAPVQKVHPADEVKFEIEVLTNSGGAEYENQEEVNELIKSFIRPFNLSEAPLLKVGLMAIEQDKHILACDMHHIISDGVSITILVKEFAHFYTDQELPELRLQYKDFSEWQNRLLVGDEIKKQELYWLSRFPGEIPVLDLPTDYPRPPVRNFAGSSITFETRAETGKGLYKLTETSSSSIFMLLLAAYSVLLAKYTGQEDIIVGSPTAGRVHADLENIIGMFLNTLALRNSPTGDKTFIEFLELVKENTLQAFENQDYQFENLVEKLNISVEPGRNPLFDAMFIFQNQEAPPIKISNIRFIPYNIENKSSKLDLMIEAFPPLSNGAIFFCITYSSKLFKNETISLLKDQFLRILDIVVENPHIKISAIENLPNQQKEQLLLDFNEEL